MNADALDEIAQPLDSGQPTEQPEPPFKPGTLVVYRRYNHPTTGREVPDFALTAERPSYKNGEWWYGLHFVQFPERGQRCGGSMWSESASKLHEPVAADELLMAARYHAAARVIAAEKELATATAERDAIEKAAEILDRPTPTLNGDPR